MLMSSPPSRHPHATPSHVRCCRMRAQVLHTPTDILMAMEYVDGGDLLEVLNTQRRRFQESEVRNIFAQVRTRLIT